MLVAYLSINVETEIKVSDITEIAASRRKLQTAGKSEVSQIPGSDRVVWTEQTRAANSRRESLKLRRPDWQ